MFARFFVLSLIAIIFLLAGCDQRPPPIQPSTDQSDNGRFAADLSLVTPLAPRRTTHITVDRATNVYLVQESPEGDDVTFVCGATDVPRATALSSANILASAGAEASDRGNIRSIAAGPGGEIYFFLLGGGRKQTVGCFGRFQPRNGAIQVLADTSELGRASTMGRSIELADATLVCSEHTVFLLLRHSDIGAMFSIDIRQLPQTGKITLPSPTTELRTAEGALPLTRPDIDLSPGAGGSVLMRDLWGGAIWNVTSASDASLICSLVGLSSAISLPGTLRDGRVVMFASEGDEITPRVEQRLESVMLGVKYPVILLTRPDGKLLTITQQFIRSPTGFPLHAMQLQQMVHDAAARDTFVGFDSSSGQIIRFKIAPRD